MSPANLMLLAESLHVLALCAVALWAELRPRD